MKTFFLLFAFFLTSIQAHSQVTGDSAVVWRVTTPLSNFTSMDVSPDGKILAMMCEDGNIILYNTLDGSFKSQNKAHNSNGKCIRFSPDGRLLATCGYDDTLIKIWNTNDLSLNKSFFVDYSATIYATFSNNGKYLAIARHNNNFQILNFESGSIFRSIPTDMANLHGDYGQPLTINFSPNDSLLALSASFNMGKLYDIYNDSTILYSEQSWYSSFSRDGKKYFSSYINPSDKNSVCIYNIENRSLDTTFPLNDFVTDADFSYDNKYLAYGLGKLYVYDISKKDICNVLPYASYMVKFIPNSNFILVATRLSVSKLDFNKIVSVTDQENLSNSNVIQISPNPSSDFINITNINPRIHHTAILNDEIKIYNSIGVFIFSVALQNPESQQIDISGLPPGLYFVRYGSEYAKFIKE